MIILYIILALVMAGSLVITLSNQFGWWESKNERGMSFIQFCTWASERAQDGHWDFVEATIAQNIIEDIRMRYHPWRQERMWRKYYMRDAILVIVEPTDKKIDGMLKEARNGSK